MALDSSLVRVAVTGAVAYAPVATAAPNDASTVLDPAYRDVGYISEDGVVETRDRSTNNIVAWQNAATVRTVVTEAAITVQLVMIESNKNSLELFYAAPVDDTDGSVEIDPAASGGRRRFVVDYIDGDEFVRLYLPEAELAEVGDSTLVSGDAVGYDVTLAGYPSATLLGASGKPLSAKKWFSGLIVAP